MLLEVLFVILLAGTAALFTSLAILNVRHGEREVQSREEWVRETFSLEDPQRLLEYTRATSGLSEVRSWIGLGVILIVLFSGIFGDVVTTLEATEISFLWRGVGFLLGIAVVGFVASIPFDLYSTFVIEELFDFNEQTPRLWIRDTIIGLAITVVLTGLLTAGIVFVLERFPVWWWVAAWGLFIGFQILLYVLYPRVIAPLFYDFQPVEEGELYEAVSEVFDRAGFSMSGIYVIDASKRTTKSNAFFAGFGRTKRVALFDTLTERLEREEIQAVLAHELAHWKYGHIWKRLGAGVLRTGAVLFVVSVLVRTEWLYAMFGVPSNATYAGLVLAGLWIGPINQLLAPLDNWLSIAHEYEADAFAAEVIESETPIKNALRKIASDNLSNPFPHPIYQAFHYDHPPLTDRLDALGDGVDSEQRNERSVEG